MRRHSDYQLLTGGDNDVYNDEGHDMKHNLEMGVLGRSSVTQMVKSQLNCVEGNIEIDKKNGGVVSTPTATAGVEVGYSTSIGQPGSIGFDNPVDTMEQLARQEVLPKSGPASSNAVVPQQQVVENISKFHGQEIPILRPVLAPIPFKGPPLGRRLLLDNVPPQPPRRRPSTDSLSSISTATTIRRGHVENEEKKFGIYDQSEHLAHVASNRMCKHFEDNGWCRPSCPFRHLDEELHQSRLTIQHNRDIMNHAVMETPDECKTVLYNKDNRIYRVKLARYKIPRINTLCGKKPTRSHTGVNGQFDKRWWVWYFREKVEDIWLPATLVDECCTYLLTIDRSDSLEVVRMARIWTRDKLRYCHLTSRDEMLALAWVPTLAVHRSWKLQQETSRLMTYEYGHKSWLLYAVVFFLFLATLILIFFDKPVFFPTEEERFRSISNQTMHALNGNIVGVTYIWPMPKTIRDKAKLVDKLYEPRDKSGYTLCAYNDHKYKPISYSNSKLNEEAMLRTRMLVETPAIDKDLMKKFLSVTKRNIQWVLGRKKKIDSSNFEVYMDSSNASPGVKELLWTTHYRLEKDGISEDSYLNKKQLYDFTKRSCFLKRENLLYSSLLSVKKKAPRGIQGAPPEFICLVAPWIHALTNHVKKKLGKSSPYVFVSGIDSEVAANILMQLKELWEDDISVFDSSVGVELCNFELWLCRYFGAPRAVYDLVKANINTHGKTFHGFTYKVKGTRKSGDPYTSLFNSLLNIFLHLFIIHIETEWSYKQMRKNVRMLACGDDNALSLRTSQEIPFAYYMLLLGFKSEAVRRKDYFDLEFCSMTLHETNRGYTFLPIAGKVLTKLGYFVDPPKDLTPLQLMRGVALGLQPICKHNPLINMHIDHILQSTSSVIVDTNHRYFNSYVKREDWHMKFSDFKVTNIHFEIHHRYMITPDIMDAISSKLERHVLGTNFNCLYMDLMFDKETLGPKNFWHGG